MQKLVLKCFSGWLGAVHVIWRKYNLYIILNLNPKLWGFPSGSDGKESACDAGDLGLVPGLRRSSREWYSNPLQYLCLENPQGQRSLVVYSPWVCKESDMTEWLSTQHNPKLKIIFLKWNQSLGISSLFFSEQSKTRIWVPALPPRRNISVGSLLNLYKTWFSKLQNTV